MVGSGGLKALPSLPTITPFQLALGELWPNVPEKIQVTAYTTLSFTASQSMVHRAPTETQQGPSQTQQIPGPPEPRATHSDSLEGGAEIRILIKSLRHFIEIYS